VFYFVDDNTVQKQKLSLPNSGCTDLKSGLENKAGENRCCALSCRALLFYEAIFPLTPGATIAVPNNDT
jgi:hypothetical protein